ncbi:MBL fold metallo-hydrolase [Longirhabdus pacifica]|uniref:MBL fold metallo-hydrolase n=1 Tax=Longirhabdus pacifica TaxID=2305227 RepID=UPI001008FAC9|nr:MBL fold metallo-hydrolase [Longirhabdus pacifica]
MLKIEKFTLGPLATNAYLLLHEAKRKAVVIDPGLNPAPLIKRLQNYEVEAILLTHAHCDHIGGVDEIRKSKKCNVFLHPDESDWLTNPMLNGSILFPQMGGEIKTDKAEQALLDGQQLNLLDEVIKVYHTPGHSPGSVSFLWNDHLFSGDVLFQQSVGRTDLPYGDMEQLLRSIHDCLFQLDDNTVVYPGHGEITSIGMERLNNPFV